MLWRRATKAGSANSLSLEPLSLEDRLARGERIQLHARPIEIGPRGRLFEFIIPMALPIATALLMAVFVVAPGSRLLALPQSAWTVVGLASAAGGYIVGERVSRRITAGYRRGLLRDAQPSAVIDSVGIDLTVPEVGLQHFDWSDVTALTARIAKLSTSIWRGRERCEMLGQNDQVLTIVPWALVLPEGDYQLGDYMVAAAPQRFALAPTRWFLAGYPSKRRDGYPNQTLACVQPLTQAGGAATKAR